MGYNDDAPAHAVDVDLHGNAYSERNLIGVAYVIEQGDEAAQAASRS